MVRIVISIKRTDEEAKSRMSGVIQDAGIGNHEVTEKKVIEDDIKRTVQITTLTKHPPI